MINSIQILRRVQRPEDFEALVDFFDAIGLGRGKAWEGRRSRGVQLLAPYGGVEVGWGEGFPDADVLIEVSDADAVYPIARSRAVKVVSEPADKDWGGRLFVVGAPGGSRVAIFSYTDPRKAGKKAGVEGALNATGLRFGIVVSRFNSFITSRLLAGALDGLRRTGAREKDIEVVRVPGAFEVPVAARTLAQTGKVDAVICLGCILRGDTTHYEHIAQEVTRGIGQSAQETGVPHAYGVLTCETLEQAIERAGLKGGNKGFEAALSAVEMASLRKAVSRQSPVAREKKALGRQHSAASKKHKRTSPRRSVRGR